MSPLKNVIQKKLKVNGKATIMVITKHTKDDRTVHFVQDGKTIPVPQKISCTMFVNKMPFSHAADTPEYFRVNNTFEFYFFNGKREICSIRPKTDVRFPKRKK